MILEDREMRYIEMADTIWKSKEHIEHSVYKYIEFARVLSLQSEYPATAQSTDAPRHKVKLVKTKAKLNEFDCELLTNQLYSSELIPKDFYLFSVLKTMVARRKSPTV